MYVYDQLIKAQLENLASDPSVTSDGLVYFNTALTQPKYFDGTLWKIFADTSSTQVFTNKDYDGGTASNTSRTTLPGATLATLQGLTRKAGTVWYATDTQSFLGDDGTNLSALGGGSGAGEINAIDNPSASTAITGWVASGAGITVARTTTGSDLPLNPIIDSAIKITPVSGTDYVRYRFTIPEGLKNRKLKVEWYQLPLAGYVDGDVKVEMYKNSASNYSGTYTEFPLSTDDTSGDSYIPNASSKFTAYFDTDDGDYYELRIVRVAGTTAINITNVIVGPGIQPQGAVVTEIQSHTLVTAGMGTITSDECTKWRVGNNLRMKGYFTVGTLSGVVAAVMEIPDGLNVDHSKMTSTRSAIMGRFKQLLASTTDLSGATYDGVLSWAIGDDRTLVFTTQSASNLFAGNVANAVLSAGATVSFEVDVPIAEWAGNGVVNLAENAMEFASNYSTSDADDLTSFAYGPGGSAGILGTNITDIRIKRVQFSTPILANDLIVLEIENHTDVPGSWVPFLGYTYKSGDDYGIGALRNRDTAGATSNTSGIAMQIRATNQVDVIFGKAANLFGGYTANWNSYPGHRWRVRKIANGAALGFAEATSSATGLAGPSGTWTPGDQGSTNVSGLAALKGYYTKVGKIVTCHVTLQIDPITGGIYTNARINVPIPANFTAGDQAIGHGATIGGNHNVGTVSSIASSNDVVLEFIAENSTNYTWCWSFQYEVQ